MIRFLTREIEWFIKADEGDRVATILVFVVITYSVGWIIGTWIAS